MKNVLIIGWNPESLNIYDKISDHPALGYKVKGFISVTENHREIFHRGIPLLGDLDSLASWIEMYQINEALIAITAGQQASLDKIIKICRTKEIDHRIVSDVYDTVYGHVIKDIYTDIFKQREFNLKRFMDFSGALLLMVFFLPLFLIIILAIKFDSKGSLFYSQIHVGKNGRRIRINKFRTMSESALQDSTEYSYREQSEHLTKIGKFLRETRLEEMPQLINILKGDMSFVGPRPDRLFVFQVLKEQVPLYEHRLEAKPGLSGWAQVRWHYDQTIEDVKEKLRYDLEYINNQNILFDLRIILSTLSKLLFQQK